MNPVKNTTILYIDDDPDDVALLQEAVSTIDPSATLLKAADGAEGLVQLHQLRESSQLPCLIVLDLNMPRLDGRETFVRLRNDKALASIPVVIFSTSNSALDKLFFQGKNVEYICKPIRYAELERVARRLLSMC